MSVIIPSTGCGQAIDYLEQFDGRASNSGSYQSQYDKTFENELETGVEVEEVIRKVETTITVGSVGDILLHSTVFGQAKVAETEYDFSPMLEDVKDLLQAPDFLMANMESVPGGVEFGLSGYPSFNGPKQIVTNLKDVGVDMLIGANNHTLDRGINTVDSALNFYNEVNMDYVGVHRDLEDRETDRIIQVEDISLGVLAYTYGLNGVPIPQGHDYVVALIDKNQISKDIENLRDKVDVLIVHMHWGPEYVREPAQEQIQLAQFLADSGVDIVFGHHPHVLQPMDVLKHEESNHETTVFYSLGNFLSGQYFEFTDVGGLGTVEITKVTEDDESTVIIADPKIEPTVVIHEDGTYRIRPMIETIGERTAENTYNEMVEHTMRYFEN